MKQNPKKTNILASLKELIRNGLRRLVLSLRRFRRKGGFSGAFSRWLASLRRKEPRALIPPVAALLCLTALISLMIPKGGEEPSGARAAAPVAMDFIDLEGEYVAMQSDIVAQEASAGPTPRPIYFARGHDSQEVAEIQQRLMDLSYMDNDEPTTLYGPNTEEAVELFQRRNELPITGVVDRAVYDLLFSDEALEYMVSIGVSGTDVEELQSRLRELDYLDKVTGYFGDETDAAVRDFQERNKLTVDGLIGPITRELLYSEDAIARSLSYGEKSDEVLSYQKRLYKLGYLESEPDGTFGRDTVNAVKLFQQQNGLMVDGHIGPSTKEMIMSSRANARVVSLGETSDTVTKIQKRLRELNYLDSRATGYFGSSTEAAVMAFQKRNSLSSDGKVGKATLNALMSDKAKKAPSDYKPSSSSGSSSSSSSSSSGSSSSGSKTGNTGGSLDKFISAARSKLGCDYTRGGKGPNTFDCSGFVYWCLKQAGVNQKYLTSSGWKSVSGYTKVSSLGSLRKGDIIVFKGHVGIAMGDGTMIDASSSQDEVVHRSCTGDWSKKNFICAWRIF